MKNNNINSYYVGDPAGWLDPWDYDKPEPKIRKIKKITRTIDKYDENGKLLSREVITEEEEITEQESFPAGTFTITNVDQPGNTSGNTSYNPDIPFTLTNGMEIDSFVANY